MGQSNAERGARFRGRHPERARRQTRESMRRTRARARARVMAAYGGKCACCGETEDAFLTIDHINGLTESHRDGRQRNGRRSDIYMQIIKEGFPDSYRVLCFNCNCAIGIHGSCPHAMANGRVAP